MITENQLQSAVRELKLSKKEVCIHASLRSFGEKLEAGPASLAAAFLKEGCTIVVPAFSHEFEQPPVGEVPLQNGMSDWMAPPVHHKIFRRDGKELSVESMGSFPRYILDHPEHVRGDNPLNSFAALGREADILMAAQSPSDVYGAFRKMYEEGGEILLVGVGFMQATVLHYAEQKAGRELFVRWARGEDGKIIPVRIGSCSRGFEVFSPCLEKVTKKIMVGGSLWQSFCVKEAVDLCAEAIRKRPEITRCQDAGCGRCPDAVKGGPIWGKSAVFDKI